MTLQELRATRRDSVLGLAAKHGASNVRVFGSVARGDSDSLSDVDFLVDLEPGRTLSDLGGLLMDLQEAFGTPVDIVTERGLRARVRERVLAEAVPGPPSTVIAPIEQDNELVCASLGACPFHKRYASGRGSKPRSFRHRRDGAALALPQRCTLTVWWFGPPFSTTAPPPPAARRS
jgi:predicted nucleotidyltransferase